MMKLLTAVTCLSLSTAATEVPAAIPHAGIIAPGVYKRIGRAPGDLKIVSIPAGLRFELDVAGDPRGEATGADCALVAEGLATKSSVVARPVPFQTDTQGLSAREIAAHPATLTITAVAQGLQLSTDYKGCALGTELGGVYRRLAARTLTIR